MKPFKPSITYDGLLKQARALYKLASSQERSISLLNASIAQLTRNYLLIGQDAINAERQINHQLTNYIDQLEGKQSAYERLLVLATKHCPNDHHDFQEIIRIANPMNSRGTNP